MPKAWTDDEKDYVRKNAHLLNDAEIAASLSRLLGRYISTKAVAHIRQKLGIEKKRGRGRPEVIRRPPGESPKPHS